MVNEELALKKNPIIVKKKLSLKDRTRWNWLQVKTRIFLPFNILRLKYIFKTRCKKGWHLLREVTYTYQEKKGVKAINLSECKYCKIKLIQNNKDRAYFLIKVEEEKKRMAKLMQKAVDQRKKNGKNR